MGVGWSAECPSNKFFMRNDCDTLRPSCSVRKKHAAQRLPGGTPPLLCARPVWISVSDLACLPSTWPLAMQLSQDSVLRRANRSSREVPEAAFQSSADQQRFAHNSSYHQNSGLRHGCSSHFRQRKMHFSPLQKYHANNSVGFKSQLRY